MSFIKRLFGIEKEFCVTIIAGKSHAFAFVYAESAEKAIEKISERGIIDKQITVVTKM